jgi:macrolide transport system ATP-binding/permease protein
LDRVAKATRARLERLQVTEKPQQDTRIQLDFSLTDPPENQFVIKIDRLSFQYNDRVIFDTITFFVKNRERVAVTGPNGVGKTTLLNLIYGRHPSIKIAPKAKIGYLHQNFSGIHMKKTVLENALHNNVQPITTVRTVLKHLLFSTSDLDKISYVLSGGERLRLGLAMLILAKNNVLLLDEPTNYLDIPSISAMEELLSSYPGTLLFVSHDDHFINTVATENVTISDFQIK